MRTVTKRDEDTLEVLARANYCLNDGAGIESLVKLEAVVAALGQANPHQPSLQTHLPDVPGVPFVRARVHDLVGFGEAFCALVPELEQDPRRLALSFIDPLRLCADELGLAFGPGVAFLVRKHLARVVSFDPAAYERVATGKGELRGIRSLRWVTREES